MSNAMHVHDGKSKTRDEKQTDDNVSATIRHIQHIQHIQHTPEELPYHCHR